MSSNTLSPPGFEVIERQREVIWAPDNTWEEKWWDEAQVPEALIAFEGLPMCIRQVDEPLPGRQSCLLTSQLNAWILRGSLTTAEAQQVQDTVYENPAFANYWAPGEEFVGWSKRPADTAFAIRTILGRRMSFSIAGSEELYRALDNGFIVALRDERHSRVVYKYAQNSVAVYDPKYSKTTGVYDMSEAGRFHSPKEPIIMV